MALRAIVFDALGVIYERPPLGVALQTLLEHYNLKPRHPTVAHNALRAAAFDANLGRISLDAFYDAVLRVHGITEQQAMNAGREALRFDAARLTLPSGTAAALRQLQQMQIDIGGLVNSPYGSVDEVNWLERMGVPSELWAVYLSSCEVGVLTPDPTMLDSALQQLEAAPGDVALVSRDAAVLETAADLGMIPVAFQITDRYVPARVNIEQVGQLVAMVAG